MGKIVEKLAKLFSDYDEARADAKAAKTAQDELNIEIKELLEKEKLDVAETPDFTCVYKFEKDKEQEVFDEEKFAAKEPKKYAVYKELVADMDKIKKKYVKKEVVKGARKLIITRKNAGEE